MLKLRIVHNYVAFFIAPSVLFFALTGSLQLFSLHEAHGNYQPPALIEKLSSVHKDQVFALGHHPAPPASAVKPAAHAQHHDAPRLGTTLLKGFFLVVALGLATSICLGLWIGLANARRRTSLLLVLAAGAAIPLALLIL